MNSRSIESGWDERTSAAIPPFQHIDAVFESFFEQSVDAVWLLDSEAGVFVDCNQAAVALSGAENKQQLLRMRPDELSPPFQPDGTPSIEKSAQIISIIQRKKAHLFEWTMRRRDGRDIPIEVSATALIMGGRNIHVIVSRDISERKRTESELRELTHVLERRVTERTAELTASEARLRTMVEHAPEAIVVYSADTGKFLFGNQHACDLYGISMSKLAELTPIDVSPEFQSDGKPTAELAREKITEVLAGGTPVFEWIHKRPDGQLIPTEVRLVRLPAEGQNLIRASIIDNSERKRAETIMRESEEKFRALFEGCSHGVVLHDEHQLLEINSAAVQIFGCKSAQELLGKHPGELAPLLQPSGEKSDVMAALYIEECITKGSARFDWLARAPSGKDIPMEVALTRIQWSGRQVIQALITDISERKRAQAELAESEARFGAAFQASPAFIGIMRVSDEKYVLANDAYLNWLDLPREEVIGRTCVELGIWENLVERNAVLNDMRTHGSIRQRECRWRNRRGERFTILLSAEAITLNNTPHMLSMAMDITQRKQTEEELLRTLEREKELSQLKSNFVSMVSHEFRTPLGIIQSSGELLRDFYARMQTEEREEQLNSIVRNTRRMAGMMEEILVLSRLDAGKLEFRPSPLDLRTFCERVMDEVLSAAQHCCPVELLVQSDLPPVNADERLLAHIFTNLLGNAVKYSENTPVQFSITRNGADAVCVIRDQGIGISDEDQTRLFAAFHRGNNVGNRSGTGLGLVLVKRCVELHHGQVQLQSALGKGTMVTVRIPVFASKL